jgi:hypothetical protein
MENASEDLFMSDDDGLSEPQLLALLDTVECEFYYFKMSLNIIFLELSIIFTLRKMIIPSSHFIFYVKEKH